MLSEIEANKLVETLLELKDKAKKNPEFQHELNKHENICVEKFAYLINMRTTRYYNFNNFDDLNQEGYEALTRAFKTYKKGKGSIFSWVHRYVKTRIQRRANNHSAMRIPLKISKELVPFKEQNLPILVETDYVPEKQYAAAEINHIINNSFNNLPEEQQELLSKYYGLNHKPYTISKLCLESGLNRSDLKQKIKKAVNSIKKDLF